MANITTQLNKWHDILKEGDIYPTYTRDTWEIPEDGTMIWCTGWEKKSPIKPYGEGMHIYVGSSVYHCDELMGKLKHWEEQGHTWGLDGVTMTREQYIKGYWTKVKI